MSSSAARSGRGVVLTNGVVAVALIAIISAVALVAKPPAPPGIAEFAPQAAKAITKAPQSQSANNGNGAGQCIAGTACPSPSASPKPTPSASTRSLVGGVPQGVPSSLQCFTWPNGAITQTFDPQSPPCVASWADADKGNGGATSRGVTAAEIRVAVPAKESAPEQSIPQAAANFLNTHFELYGRKIVLVDDTDAVASSSDPSGQLAEAANAAEKQSFAAVYNDDEADNTEWVAAMARHHIVGVTQDSSASTNADMAQYAPYAFAYSPSIAAQEANLGEFLCKSFVGHAAQYAGQPAYRTKTRKLAILYPGVVSGTAVDTSVLAKALAACANPVTAYQYDGEALNKTPDPHNTQLMTELRSKGVTTVVLLGNNNEDSPDALTAANGVAYRPEWMTLATGDYTDGFNASPADELSSLMGLAYWNKALPPDAAPGYQSIIQTDPNIPTRFYDANSEAFYKSLLLIASGIQAAGPDLTPGSFSAALHSLDFPNPEPGVAPYYQATVGFGSGGYSMTDDYGLWFYSSRSNEEADDGTHLTAGGYCLVNSGQRWSLGNWPTKDPGFFGSSDC